MNNLQAFLKPAVAQGVEEVYISTRFQDENGDPVPFKIRALSQEENESLNKQAKRQRKVNGRTEESLDAAEFVRRVVVAGTVEPDFKSTQLCEAYGVLDPQHLPGKMLLAGEYSKLSAAIMRASGFDDNATAEDDAKN